MLGANYPAEYGRSLGSVLNVVYKSGTNQFHGSGYEFFRDSAFDANNYFAKRAGNAARRLPAQPVRRRRRRADPTQPDLLHDLVRGAARAARSRRRPRPCPRWHSARGTSRRRFAQNGQLIRTLRSVLDAARIQPGGFIRDQFAGNVIPAARMDPVALQVLNYFPLPNQAGQPDHRSAQLLRDRHRPSSNVEQLRRARRSPALRQTEALRALLVPQRRSARPRPSSPRTSPIAEGRVNEQNLRPQRRHRLQPDDVEHDAC